MSSSPHPQNIKPYIPKKLCIDGNFTYFTFHKRKPKIICHFIFQNQTSSRSDHPRKLLRVTKQLKHVHHLDLSEFYIQRTLPNLSYIISSAKKMSRIHLLSNVNHNTEGSSLKAFQIWPNYFCRLKALTDFDYKDCLRLVDGKSSSVLFRYQNRLESFQTNFNDNFYPTERLSLGQYPISLKRLTFFGGNFQHPVSPKVSLERFKNLKVLELIPYEKSSTEFINSFLSLLPKVPHLESLSFISPSKDFPGLEENFQSLKTLTKLKHIKILVYSLTAPHAKALLKALRELPLTSLNLQVRIFDPKDVKCILKLLRRLAALETLKLRVSPKSLLEPSIVQKIIARIDNLQNLKHLSLRINVFGGFVNRNLFETIELPFSNLFTKPIPLESFRIESDHVKISNEAFLDLLKSVQKQTPNLKKIKLAIREVFLDQKEFKKVLRFFRKIHRDVRVLKLSMLGMDNRIHFKEIVEAVQTLKYLRSFGLGKFKMNVSQAGFWTGLKKILEKQGLVKFTYDVSKDFDDFILSFARECSGINWLAVKKKNPALKTMCRKIYLEGQDQDPWTN